MGTLKDNKTTIIVAIVIMAVLYAYNLFSSSIVASAPQGVGQDLIKISNSLSQADLNRGLFTQSGYRLLNDFSTPLSPEPFGRTNPFAPIGSN
jgi:hypothetical protein